MFENRSVAGIENRLFGGIDEQSNIANVKQGFALDMDNFELDPTQAVRRRDGYSLVADLGNRIYYLGTYYTSLNDQVFVAVVDGKFYEATDIAGPWTDRTGSVTLSQVAGPWIGTDLGGRFVLANGVDAPITHKYGENAQTIKQASLVAIPGNLLVTPNGTTGAAVYNYGVTAITARGETPASYAGTTTGNGTLSATNYNALTWNPQVGAQGYNIYRYNTTEAAYVRLASVGPTTSSYNDTSPTSTPWAGNRPPNTNTAYNTPTVWDSTPPRGFVVVSRGRAQRVIAFADSYIWASALSDPLDWLTPNDAFDQPVYGGKDNSLVAAATLYDYTVFWSGTNTFVYSGSSSTDFSLVKILNVGCKAPHSVVTAGDELYFWSEVGPNSFSRVMAGQDIQTNPGINGPVQNTVSSLSNRSYWSKIVAWNHVRANRLGWAYPNGTSTSNNKAILLGYAAPKGSPWSRHSMPAIVNAVVDDLRIVYVGCEDGNIYKLYDGNTDNGTAIAGTYETGWYDSQSFLNRNIAFLDVVCDKTAGAYSLTVQVYFDFATTTQSTHTLTNTQTDGIDVVIQTPTVNIHRIYVRGFGRYFKFKFSVTSSDTAPRILGWRPEMYSKGIR